MRQTALAHRLPSVARHASPRGPRRWRRMRARIGLIALWAALLVWALGASVRVPGEVDPPAAAAVIGLTAPGAHADGHRVDPADIDLERAAAWPSESADAWQAPSQEAAPDALPGTAPEPNPEEEAALYIAGR